MGLVVAASVVGRGGVMVMVMVMVEMVESVVKSMEESMAEAVVSVALAVAAAVENLASAPAASRHQSLRTTLFDLRQALPTRLAQCPICSATCLCCVHMSCLDTQLAVAMAPTKTTSDAATD